MTPHDLTLTALQREGVLRACAQYNAALPRDAQGVLLEGHTELTADQYFDARVIGMCDSWAQQHCSCSGFDLAERFTADEYAAIIASGKTDAQVAGFIARLRKSDPINVASPKFWGALQYLYELELIHESRVNDIAGITVSGGLTVSVG